MQYKIAADYKMFLDLYFTGNLKFQFVEEKIAFFSIGGVSALQYEKSASEHSEIMHQYNLPKENIIIYKKMHKYNCLYKIKKVVKYLMEKIGMLGLTLKLFGWKNHKCENYFCHYCNR